MNKKQTIFDKLNSEATTINTKGEQVAISTKNYNVDLFQAQREQSNILELFSDAYREDNKKAIMNLLYILDRKGKGDRKNFKEIFKYLISKDELIAYEIAKVIGKYGRYDYLFVGLEFGNFKEKVLNIITEQLKEDIDNFKKQKQVSLLAKWLPSHRTKLKINGNKVNVDSKLAKILIKHFATSKLNKHIKNVRDYRKILSQLRAYLHITETKLSAKKQIDFDKVTSKNLSKYKRVFSYNDLYAKDYQKWLDARKTIKSDHFDFQSLVYNAINKYAVSEQEQKLMDKAFKDLVSKIKTDGKPLIILDASYSMWSDKFISDATLTSLAIIAATNQEKLLWFSNDTFSKSYFPHLSLYQNIRNLSLRESGAGGTNFENVAEFLTKHNKEIVRDFDRIIILSDQEFDVSVRNLTVRQQIAKIKLPKIYIDYKKDSYFKHFYNKQLGVAVITGRQQIINDMVKSVNFKDMEDFTNKILFKYKDEVEQILSNVKKLKLKPQLDRQI